LNSGQLSFLALSLFFGPGSPVPPRLLDIYGNGEELWGETPFSLSFKTGLQEKRTGFLNQRGRLFERAHEHLELVTGMGGRLLLLTDPDYPQLLKHIHAPPSLLYVSGDAHVLSGDCLAVVGTRHASAEAMALTRRLSRKEADEGKVVVSGLARGIDAAAHRGALDAKGGRTVAVLGCGIDVAYPAAHWQLREEIRKQGAVVSEFPPGWEPRRSCFPMRNRIISGLSGTVVVVEAPVRSGSLITARIALDQGREVKVCGWEKRTLRNEGVFRLMEEGAPLYQFRKRVRPGGEGILSAIPEQAARILRLLDERPATLSMILSSIQRRAEQVIPCLVRLELSGLVCFRDGSWWATEY